MKKYKLVSLLALCLFLALPARGQGRLNSLDISVNGYPFMQQLFIGYGKVTDYRGSSLGTAYSMPEGYGPCYLTPLVKLQYTRYIGDNLAISLGSGVSVAWQDETPRGGTSRNAFTGYYITAIPSIRYVPVNRDNFKLYCAFGVGLFDRLGYGINSAGSNLIGSAFQWCPVGVQIGSKWHLNIETGLGFEGVGVNMGFGFSF